MPPPPQAPGAAANYNTMATVSMWFGIFGCVWILAILAVIFGFIAKNQIKRTGEAGDSRATAGLVLGFVWTGIYVVVLIIYMVALASVLGTVR